MLWREGSAPQHLITIRGSQPSFVRRVFLGPDGRWMINAGEDNTARLWELPGGTERLAINERVHQAIFNADGTKMVTLGTESWVTVWDLTKRRKLKVLRGHDRMVQSVALSRDGTLVATGDEGGKVKIWSASLGRELGEEATWQNVAVYSPDGRRIVSSAFLQGWTVRSSQSGHVLLRVHPANEVIVSIAFSPDGQRIVTAGSHKAAKVWEVDSGRLLLTLRGHRRQVYCVAYSRDGRLIATGSFDGTVKIWDARNGNELRTLHMDPLQPYALTGYSHVLLSVEFDESTSRLITGNSQGRAKVWDVETGRLLTELRAGSSQDWVAAKLHPDGSQIATCADESGAIRLWNMRSGQLIKECKVRGLSSLALDISGDGCRLIAPSSIGTAYGYDSGTVGVWDIKGTQRETLSLSGREMFSSIAFSPDSESRKIITTSMDFGVHQWETFPWKRPAYYENRGQGPEGIGPRPESDLAQRVRRHARTYWRERLAAEREARGENAPPPKIIELPVDRALFSNRDSGATPRQIDLTGFYTGELTEPFLPNIVGISKQDNDLSALPRGLVSLGGIVFDVRGVIQLRRSEPLGGPFEAAWENYPVRIDRIRVDQEVRRLHLLLGATSAETEGTVVGSLVLHYADGNPVQLDLVYGRDVRDWWWDPHGTAAEDTDRGRVVWTGRNPPADFAMRSLRLYVTSRENPFPEAEIASIDFVSAMSGSALFLIALTVE